MTDRELDALVAERVMGFHLPKPRTALEEEEGPHYSTTGDGMLVVVEEMRKRGHPGRVSWGPDASYGAWFWERVAHVGEREEDIRVYFDADHSLPRAVCLAALKALGVEVEA